MDTNLQIAPNADTGELVTSPIKTYDGISEHPLTKEQRAILQAPTPHELVKLRPDGLPYVDNIHYRKRLDDAFGVGGWSLKPLGSTMQAVEIKGKPATRIFVQGQLWCEGRFISESVGEDVYYHNNPNDSYATGWEKAKSNLLVRCCKELGLFRELWDKDWLAQNDATPGRAPYPRKAVMENSEPLESLEGRVKDVTSEEKSKNGKTFKLYRIELESESGELDGMIVATFDRELSARAYKSRGTDCIFEIQRNGNYEPKLLNLSVK